MLGQPALEYPGVGSTAGNRRPESSDWLIKLSGARYRAGAAEILFPIDWTLDHGQNWAVLGSNGAGKSTFLRLIMGEIWPAGDRRSRLYRTGGQDQVSPLGFKDGISLVSPELWEQYRQNRWNLTGLEAVCSGHWNTPLLYQEPSGGQWASTREIMDRLSLNHLAGKGLMQMSRGQAQKIMIARALVSEPKLLVLDECCAGLDPSTRDDVLAAVQAAAENGTQILMATHHKDELPRAISHALILKADRVVRQGPVSQVLETALDVPAADPPPPPIQALNNHADPGSLLFGIENVDVVRGGQTILRDLNWNLKAGENWAVLGANGSGKTTLMGLLLGDFLPVIGGTIRRFHDDPQNIWDIRKRVGYLSAEFQAGHEHEQTALETVVSGFHGSIGLITQRPSEAQFQAARRWLDFFGMAAHADQDVRTLSYGQLRKVLLARALVHDPQVLFLDEPVGVLDPVSRGEVLALLEKLARSGLSLVLVTHRPQDLIPSITHIAVIEEGRLVFQGPKADYLQNLER